MAYFFLCVLVSVSLLTHGDQSELRSQYEQLQSDIRYDLGPDNDMLSSILRREDCRWRREGLY